MTPWAIARQAYLSMGFFRQEYRVSSHSLLQGIFPTQGSNPSLLHYRQILYNLSHQGSPVQSKIGLKIMVWPSMCPWPSRQGLQDRVQHKCVPHDLFLHWKYPPSTQIHPWRTLVQNDNDCSFRKSWEGLKKFLKKDYHSWKPWMAFKLQPLH